MTITYSLVDGIVAGGGNIDADPLFTDGFGDDDLPWTGDEDVSIGAGSPCIDAADNGAVPESVIADLAGNPRFVDDPDTPDTGLGDSPIVDMGPYEWQPQVIICPPDLNGDGVVDVADLVEVVLNWGTPDGDVTGDELTNVEDLVEVITNWGPCG